MRLGLFGGSFDPFHLGHFLVARTAQELFGLTRVVFLPCAHSPLKKARPVADERARLTMLRKGLAGQSWAEVSGEEIRRGGISYTVDTARAWRKKHPHASLHWIMGSDQWNLLPSWREPQELRTKLRFLVFPRPDSPRPRQGFRMQEIPLRLDISATDIRQRAGKKLPLTGLVLPSVERLIQKNRWYR